MKTKNLISKYFVTIISIIIISCNKFNWGYLIAVNDGKYFLTEIENKRTHSILKISSSNNFPKLEINGLGFFFYKTKNIYITYFGQINTSLTSNSTKTTRQNRDIYYDLVDSLSNKPFSIKIHGSTQKINGVYIRKIEISNLIEGKYEILKDTLIYRYNDAGCCL